MKKQYKEQFDLILEELSDLKRAYLFGTSKLNKCIVNMKEYMHEEISKLKDSSEQTVNPINANNTKISNLGFNDIIEELFYGAKDK